MKTYMKGLSDLKLSHYQVYRTLYTDGKDFQGTRVEPLLTSILHNHGS